MITQSRKLDKENKKTDIDFLSSQLFLLHCFHTNLNIIIVIPFPKRRRFFLHDPKYEVWDLAIDANVFFFFFSYSCTDTILN